MANMTYIRWLATSPYVEMCVDTIINEVASIPWDIVPEEGFEGKVSDEQIEQIKTSLTNPNTNYESFEDVFIRMAVRDLLEIGNFVWIKVFNLAEDMVEIVTRDAATFTKNPDIHGMFTDRDEIVLQHQIFMVGQPINIFQEITQIGVKERAAYFQYGWMSGPIPVPFGKREIVWGELKKRTDSHYVYSPIQILANTLQALIWAIEADVEFFNDNNVPAGIIGLEGADSESIDAFRDQWFEVMRKKDAFGNAKRAIHKVPMVGQIPKFERISLTADEMQLIEKQKWWSKLVWSCFGLTPTNLGYTEDAQGEANQIVQSKTGRKRAVNPVIRLIEEKINKEIISEFEFEHIKFKFMVFDTDEERNKAELYKLQIEAGIKTLNQIREQEGDDPVEWGDDKPSNWQRNENAFNFNNFDRREQEAQETSEARKLPEAEKPGQGAREVERRVERGGGKKQEKAEVEMDTKKKAHNTDSPLILAENERPTSYKKLKKSILYVLRENEKIVKNLIEQQVKPDIISQIKDIHEEQKAIDDVIRMLKGALSMGALKKISDTIIANNFIDGWEESQQDLLVPFQPDQVAIKTIQEYTFDNIKDINDTIVDDLRQELSRGLMEGEGTVPLLKRVTKVFDVGENRAEKIARTETNRASNKGKLLRYKAAGIPADKWLLITNDDRTSEISKAMGREYGEPDKAIPLDELFSVVVNGKPIEGQTPPFHVNERDKLMIKPRPMS